MEWRRAYDFLFALLGICLELKTHEYSLSGHFGTTSQAMPGLQFLFLGTIQRASPNLDIALRQPALFWKKLFVGRAP